MNNLRQCFDENYKRVKENIASSAEKSGRKPEDIILLAATKTVEADMINYAYSKGIDFIGENRVQEFLSKENQLDAGIRRQFIGTLQTNKVRQIVGKVELIQSVDSLKLAKEISSQSVKRGIVTDILVEINIADENNKGGINEHALDDFLHEVSSLAGIKVRGLMTLGPANADEAKKIEYFYKMKKLFIDNSTKKVDNVYMDILSMGMSGDYSLAVECGANMIRLGTALFGQRNY